LSKGPKKKQKTGKDHHKSKCISAGEGLTDVAKSMEVSMQTITDSIINAIQPKTAHGSSSKVAAISAIKNDKGLSENEFNEAAEMIMGNAEAATMYLAIKNPAACTQFLQLQLQSPQQVISFIQIHVPCIVLPCINIIVPCNQST